MSDRRPDAFGRFIGGLILAVGVLVAFLSGACTLTIAGPSLMAMVQGHGGAGAGLILVLIFGGLPFAAGVAMALLGWSVVRPRRRRATANVFGDDAPPP